MTEQAIREKIVDIFRPFSLWQDRRKYTHEEYVARFNKDADQILALIKEAGKDLCYYCNKEPDGAMLTMGYQVAHTNCVIQKLNELLDPDWEIGDTREPDKVVGFWSGYVRLADDQSLPCYLMFCCDHCEKNMKQAQQDMLKGDAKGVWRKIELEVKE